LPSGSYTSCFKPHTPYTALRKQMKLKIYKRRKFGSSYISREIVVNMTLKALRMKEMYVLKTIRWYPIRPGLSAQQNLLPLMKNSILSHTLIIFPNDNANKNGDCFKIICG
jgi:hypothetical protein